MTRAKPPGKNPSTTHRQGQRRDRFDAAMQAAVQDSVRAIFELIDDAEARGAFDAKHAPPRTSKPSTAVEAGRSWQEMQEAER